MKLTLKFTGFFIVGLFTFIMYMGILMLLFFEGLFPLLSFKNTDDNIILFLFVFFICFVSGGFVFSFYFVKPVIHIIFLIKNLSAGNFDLIGTNKELYTRENKLKWRYLLYKEVITNLYKLADDLEQANIERNQLEEAKKNWIRGVSHDLKTPLSYVIGYSALLLKEEYTWNEAETNNFLNLIHSKGEYMAEMIGDLNLSFKLNEKGTKVPLTTTSYNIVDSMQKLIADIMNNPKAFKYDFSFDTTTPSIIIQGDEKLLNRVFENLLMNAVLHNEAGTKIHITITKTNNQILDITISDNGTGMESNAAPSTNSDNGWGFGLTVVENIVEAHNGTISFVSKPSIGTTCHISLPLFFSESPIG